MNRPTMRRNGKACITIRVRHDLDLWQLGAVWAFAHRDETEPMPKATKAALRAEIESHLAMYGLERLDFWGDQDVSDDRHEEAMTAIRELFPGVVWERSS